MRFHQRACVFTTEQCIFVDGKMCFGSREPSCGPRWPDSVMADSAATASTTAASQYPNLYEWRQSNFSHWPAIRIIGIVYVSVWWPFICTTCGLRKNNCAKRIRNFFKGQLIFFGFFMGLGVHWFGCIWWTCDFNATTDSAELRTISFLVVWATITCCMAAFSNQEYIESLKSGTKQMERSAELMAAKEMDDDVIAEVYRKKKKEGRLKRTTTAEMSSMVSRAVKDNHQSALADLELRVDALLDTASPAHDDWRRRGSGVGT